jgi:hypothetical protein
MMPNIHIKFTWKKKYHLKFVFNEKLSLLNVGEEIIIFPLLVLGIRDYNLVKLLVYIDKDETICSDSYNIKPLVFVKSAQSRNLL